MMDINEDVLQWSINFLTKKYLTDQLNMKIYQRKSYLKNYTSQLSVNSKKEKYTNLL